MIHPGFQINCHFYINYYNMINRISLITFLIVIVLLLFNSCRLFKKNKFDYEDDYVYDYDTTSYKYDDEPLDLYDSQPQQSAYEIITDIVHTKLDVRFDWDKQYLYGKEWITLKPRLYPVDSVILDAQGMFINKIELVADKQNTPLTFSYFDSVQLRIALGRKYALGESITLYIDYISRPEKLKDPTGSLAITGKKGLYFINPKNEEKGKPRQIWTQGETESNSVWFPTIDKPNMKSTLELSMTVDTALKTLSNGIMTSSNIHNDGTRTDTWKLDKPFAPYLVMMAVGNFSISKDKWKNIDVNYYTDPEYASYAKKIFGNTPEMLTFYSEKFGYEYPWPKYNQVVVHDFVSGAMENVTATVHYDGLHQTSREMIDENHEDIIAHELSHQWFGDLVTCKSWGQIPLNESFATYSEALWIKYKYGSFEADKHSEDDLIDYLNEADVKQMPLIRYRYWDKEDLFDAHSYQKGGYVLRMLHALVGDDAFTKSLSYYLKNNEYKTVEIDQLRIAFETVTGRDLKWFFDQWFHRPGHPHINIYQEYIDSSGTLSVSINQSPSYSFISEDPSYAQAYRLPLAIDIYTNIGIQRFNIIFESLDSTYYFNIKSTPLLVNVDADKKLLCTKTDNKPTSQFIYQFQNAPLYKDKMEALQEFANQQYEDSLCSSMIQEALKHKHWAIRDVALEYLEINDLNKKSLLPLLKQMALSDSSSKVRSSAMSKFYSYDAVDYIPVLIQALNTDSSYKVIAEALYALNQADNKLALQEALKLHNENNPVVSTAVLTVYAGSSDTSIAEKFAQKIAAANSNYKFNALMIYGRYLISLSTTVQPKLLQPLYTAAEFEKNWLMRYAAISTLYQMRSEWEAETGTLSEEMNKLKEDSNEYKEKQKKLDLIQNQIELMNQKFIHLQSKEENDLLKNFYGK